MKGYLKSTVAKAALFKRVTPMLLINQAIRTAAGRKSILVLVCTHVAKENFKYSFPMLGKERKGKI